jgi:hypothetical protein
MKRAREGVQADAQQERTRATVKLECSNKKTSLLRRKRGEQTGLKALLTLGLMASRKGSRTNRTLERKKTARGDDGDRAARRRAWRCS